jgi:hypothetical protein
MKLRISIVVLIITILSSVAAAGGTWSEKISYSTATSTSLKVLEPDGFKVTVGDKAATVPEIFQLANADAYVQVTIQAPDGTKWSKKVEVRAKHMAQVVVTFTPAKEPKAAAHRAARNHIGRFVNGGKGCGKTWDRAIKAEFRRPDGDAVKATVELAPGEYKDVEVPAGGYEVRVSFKDGAAWKFALTGKHDIGKDGWALGFGCKPGAKTPVLVGN